MTTKDDEEPVFDPMTPEKLSHMIFYRNISRPGAKQDAVMAYLRAIFSVDIDSKPVIGS